MPEPSLTAIFAGRLNMTDIAYIITGAVASIVYGEPRLTRDLDLVVMMRREDARDNSIKPTNPSGHLHFLLKISCWNLGRNLKLSGCPGRAA